jgi:hypothetical protein
MSKHNELRDKKKGEELCVIPEQIFDDMLYRKLRDKINEICPELMELEFGCEVEWETPEGTETGLVISEIGICLKGHKKAKSCNMYCEFDDGIMVLRNSIDDPYFIDFRKTEITKILGRPITLEDVMRAIEKSGGCYEFNGKLAIGKNPFEKEDIEWELGKPLSQQSSETVEAILEILK